MIDTTTFKSYGSVWKDIHAHLKQRGFNVYAPSEKIGECLTAYVVVKKDGLTEHLNTSSYDDLYSVMCYVPKSNYAMLDEYVQDVKAAMHELRPLVLPYGQETPSYYDDSVKAHMISIEYKNYKKGL